MIKGVYVVENFLLGWSPRLRRCPPVAARSRDGINTGTLWRNYKSLLKPDRCRHTAHHQRVSLFTSAIPRTTQPMIQNHLRSHLPSSTTTTLYSTLLYKNPTLHSTLLNPTLLNKQLSNPSSGIQSPVCDKVDALTAQSVQPQGSHLPKVGGWNQDTIHLEIEEVLEKNCQFKQWLQKTIFLLSNTYFYLKFWAKRGLLRP